MKTYIGTKTIKATPAIRKGGKVYLPGDQIPRTMEPVEEGYKVVYEDGYESWSPKDVFEKAYHVAETPLDRMKIEQAELSNKIGKLTLFIQSEKFQTLDRLTKLLLALQNKEMEEYLDTLTIRMDIMEQPRNAGDEFPLGISGLSFGSAVLLLNAGYSVRRKGWNGKGMFLIKQVPATIDGTIIPKMQSIPDQAKDLIMKFNCSINYQNQCLIYHESTGIADSWSPSITDAFATDWEPVL